MKFRKTCWVNFLNPNLKVREYLEVISPLNFFMMDSKNLYTSVVIEGFTKEGRVKIILMRDHRTNIIEGVVLTQVKENG